MYQKGGDLCFSVWVAEMLMATDHNQDALRLVSAVESLCLMHARTGQEDGSLVDRLMDAVNVAEDDIAGVGLSGYEGKVVYMVPDGQSHKLFVRSVSEERSLPTPGVLSGRWRVGLILLRNCCKWQLRLACQVKGRRIRSLAILR
jgi:hypothetical protein